VQGPRRGVGFGGREGAAGLAAAPAWPYRGAGGERRVILVEHGPGGGPAVFDGAREIVAAWKVEEVAPALARLDAARAAGAWVAGWMAYEAGHAFEARLRGTVPQTEGPLVAMGVFDAPALAAPVLAAMAGAAGGTVIAPPEARVTRAAYDHAIGQVLSAIAAGDCYQVNLTFPMETRLVAGSGFGLYGRLRRTGAVGHGAYVDFGAALPGAPVVVSRSPELFFAVERRRITARPMKGTAPRDPDPARDEAIATELQASAKARAENLMIVDLLRNDIGRLARVGTVQVPALYAMERYATVHQMTSTVEGELADPPTLGGLMPALFPCGSVTGAPKLRAMEIIRAVEGAARGVYCGAVGWMAPSGDADFSVAIRTLSVWGERVVLNVGGGVVAESTAAGEWEEALWKARFVTAAVSRG
jgi:para-aminobenzoate synthetase component 1